LRAERAELGGVGQGVADGEAVGNFGRDFRGFLISIFRDQHPSQRGAGLAGVEVAAVDRALHGAREIGVVEDHRGALASKLEGHALDALRRQL
jgi:hypothetical protein